MPTTSRLNLPYPAETDPPNVPVHIKDLAESTEAAVLDVEYISSGASAGAGWSVAAFEAIRRNGLCQVHITLNRTGSVITAGTYVNSPPDNGRPGNIADTTLCTLPVGWRPALYCNAIAGDGYAFGECTITQSGAVTLRSWTPGATVANGGINLRIDATFFLP